MTVWVLIFVILTGGESATVINTFDKSVDCYRMAEALTGIDRRPAGQFTCAMVNR